MGIVNRKSLDIESHPLPCSVRAEDAWVYRDKSRAEIMGMRRAAGDGLFVMRGEGRKHSRHTLDSSVDISSLKICIRRSTVYVFATVKMCFRTGLWTGLARCLSW